MHRFFVAPQQLDGPLVHIEGSDAKHISRVLRLGPGDQIMLLDGNGRAARARIVAVHKDTVTCSILEYTAATGEPPLRVILLQALPKGDKLEQIIQKAVELGVHEVWPVQTRRCVVQLAGEKATARQNRWQRVAYEAAKQCRRPAVPQVRMLLAWADALAALPPSTLLILPWEEEAGTGLKSVLNQPVPATVAVAVGPEGGWAPEEVELARRHGARTVSLGPRILRTETAGPAVLAALMFHWGDLG
ncbi:MAG: 16S rRNA (uracil(1498)-N(3))-methyltransferase [Bacillota bacterium]|uniref:16S rRNA (uracil(1498)-N(3))-methyltransferase n=1 Tax=Desulfurispora thermophila TaxID=265470 RepID=UPI000367B452|nr:16S rRNA (uracil(1498)-N(3))-methyltransferase [Desulfurispora thermophila]